MDPCDRRQVLVLCGAATGALAGCLGDNTDDTGANGETNGGDGSSDGDNGNRLAADGTVLALEGDELAVEEMGDAEVVKLDAGVGPGPELRSAGDSVSPTPGLYPVIADADPDDPFDGETVLGTVQVGDVVRLVETWEEGQADLENATVEDGVLLQQDPDSRMIAEFALGIDGAVGQMLVFPDDRAESEAEVVLTQPGASYGFFVDPEDSGGQGRPAGRNLVGAFEPGSYTLVVDSEPNVDPPSPGIVALDRVEFYAGTGVSIRERGG